MDDSTLSIVKSASQQLSSLLIEHQTELSGEQYKIEKLQLDLEWCRIFLLYAEKNSTSPLIRKWVSEIRCFAGEAVEIINQYVQLVYLIQQDGCCNCMRTCCCAYCDGKALHHIGSGIDDLSHRVSKLVTRIKYSGEARVLDSSWIMTPDHIYTEKEKDGTIVDFQGTKTIIEELLKPEHRVIVLHGRSGSGKTTMAKMMYDDPKVRGHFDGFVWISVSQEPGAMEVLERIWLDLCGGDYRDPRDRIKDFKEIELKRMINAALGQRKLLLVLDDIRREQSWLRLQSGLPMHQNSTSKLILTTSSDEVQRLVTNYDAFPHQPKLGEAESLKLLKDTASRKGPQIDDNDMNLWGKGMIQHCDEFPLAIVLLGGILAFKESRSEWEAVHDSVKGKVRKETLPQDVMDLSFSELPSYIRPCFLHFGNLPKGLDIPSNKLCRMWVAEGLVNVGDNIQAGKKSLTPEEVAEVYLNELVKRCLVQVTSLGKIQNKKRKVKGCRMHDLLKSMCVKRGTELYCCRITSTDIKEAVNSAKKNNPSKTDIKESAKATKKRSKADIKETRVIVDSTSNSKVTDLDVRVSARALHGLSLHLLLDSDRESKSLPDAVIKNCDHLKSLLFIPSNGKLPWRWLKSIKVSPLLRVLHLENAEIVSLPDDIGNLLHLKYLSLRGTTVEHEIPSSIGDLSGLETLDLRAYGTHGVILGIVVRGAGGSVLLPNVFWKLKKLRHLFLPQSYLCKLWRKLHLYTLTKLETLKNLDVRRCKVGGLLQLSSLMKITWITGNGNDIFESKDKETLLQLLESPNVKEGCLKNKLIIKVKGEFLSDVNESSKLAELEGYKKSVQGLVIWGGLTSPLNSDSIRKVLKIEHLTSLVLRFTKLKEDPMLTLETLPSLEKLRLSYHSFTGKKMSCKDEGFSKLTYLKLDMLPDLEEWEVQGGAMPLLDILEIDYCGKLKKLPDGLNKKVEVRCLLPCIHGHKNHGICPFNEGPRENGEAADQILSAAAQASSSGQTVEGDDEDP